jgi:tRNA U34 5-methylaminomethyl-2-thiouridine-forming methyltransferase MnmC
MKLVKTSDGSVTFFSSEFNETYHSTTGAYEEAVKKYAEPCKIATFDKVRILDVCFGLGYNSAAALDAFHGTHIEIIGLENDEEILKEIESLETPFKNYDIIKQAAKKKFYSSEKIMIKIVVGDARETVKKLVTRDFDVVFFDPFSPKKCPELWTAEFLSDVFSLMKPKGVLATYSCAKSVRENLTKAGFTVMDGPCVGRKSPSTIATKH